MHYKIKSYKLRTRRYARKVEKRYRYHPRIVPILAGIAILGLALILAITLRDSEITVKKIDTNIVVLHADDETRILPTDEQTVGAFLEKAGVVINEGDVVEPGLEEEVIGDDFRINVYRGGPAVIFDEGKRITTYSAATTPRSMAEQAGLKLYAEDIVKSEPVDDFLRDGIGHKVTIKRSVPVSLVLYGTPLAMRTHAKTVRQLLEEKSIVLGEGETVQPGLDDPLPVNEPVFINQKGVTIETKFEEIPMPIEYVDDPTLSFGVKAIRQNGQVGQKLITYQVNTETNQRTKFKEIIITEPVTQIIARGTFVNITSDKTAVLNAAGIPASQHPYVDYIFSHESHWNAASVSARNCIGLGQNCPDANGNHWLIDACPNWQNDPVCQTKRFTVYAGRYGGWEGAYNWWVSHHWW